MTHHPRFDSTPNWKHFATKNNIPLPSNKPPLPIDQIPLIPLNYTTSRTRQHHDHTQWRASHPLSLFNYTSSTITIPARDTHPLNVKISYPDATRMEKRMQAGNSNKLPVFFVTMGGGWIQGTHTTEERWVLWPLYEVFDLVVVSVEYRVGPENEAPIWVDDSWDVLGRLCSGVDDGFVELEQRNGVRMDLERLILGGSSAGAGISAALSQRCRDEGVGVWGVVLNVPVLCDWRHFERVERELGVGMRSYEGAGEAVLPSGVMKWIWETLYPEAERSLGADASPLLGRLEGLPRHVVFVAGQDALCDEGLAYAKKLGDAGVDVSLEVYEGVPHIFGEFWELEATKKWWGDMRECLGKWLEQ